MPTILASYAKTVTLSTQAVDRLVELSYDIGEVTKIFEGDGLDPEDDSVGINIPLRLTFNNAGAAEVFLSQPEGNLVVTGKIKGTVDTNPGTWTFKNVRGQSSTTSLPRKSGQQTGTVTVNARARVGAGDTLASIITYAPPAPPA